MHNTKLPWCGAVVHASVFLTQALSGNTFPVMFGTRAGLSSACALSILCTLATVVTLTIAEGTSEQSSNIKYYRRSPMT